MIIIVCFGHLFIRINIRFRRGASDIRQVDRCIWTWRMFGTGK